MKILQKIIDQNGVPFYKRDLMELLDQLGITGGDTVILHTSLNAFGYLVGAEETVIDSMLEKIGPSGTLVMPTQTSQIGNPVYWEYPPVPAKWQKEIRNSIAPYDPKKTPVAKELGRVSGYFAFYPNTHRSAHPLYSFTARGKKAAFITDHHGLDYGFGHNSPLGKLYHMGTKILLLGTDFESNTSLHLAEYHLNRPDLTESAPILVDGVKKWITFKNVDLDLYDDFLEIEKLFYTNKSDETIIKNFGPHLKAQAKVMDMKECVDFCTEYYLAREAGNAEI